MKCICLPLIFTLLLWKVPAVAQSNTGVMDIIGSVSGFTASRSMEKLYLQTDKPSYQTGDTLWFKAYLFNAAYLTATGKSGIAYVEIAGDNNRVIKRFMLGMSVGLGWGNIPLDEKDFPQGNYHLRAYTNWMRNFDAHYIFNKQFYIGGSGENDLLINSKIRSTDSAGKRRADVALRLTHLDGRPIRLNDFQLKLTRGGRVWYKDNFNTLTDGSINFHFYLPAKPDSDKLAVTLQNLKKEGQSPVYTVPLALNLTGDTDLQFMPEGGYLVAGIATRIAFKALAPDGTGAAVSGSVYDSRQNPVAKFSSAHLGIGEFYFCPQPGETYTARIKFANGSSSKPYALPPVSLSGIVFNIDNKLEADSLEVNIDATADVLTAAGAYYLVGQSRGVACYGALIPINRQKTRIMISKRLFPTGVARLTLLNASRRPVNERIVYIDHNDHLRVRITPDKNYYRRRDSVSLAIMVTDQSGKPVRASLSVAVTDDSQVKTDSLKSRSLKSDILLASDLKGEIEDPGYYFPPVLNAEIAQRLDNLLLAQGWVNYDWKAVFQPPVALPFAAEPDFSIKGMVSNAFNKPLAKTEVILLSKKPSFVRDTLTGNDGRFSFNHIYPADTAIYLIQAKNQRGKANNVGVDVEEFKAPVFNYPAVAPAPWYVNTDTSSAKALNNIYLYKKEQDNLPGMHRLNEVTITAKKVIKDSKNLNGDGGADLTLSQEDLEKAGRATLYDLLKKNVKGFGIGMPKLPFVLYRIGFNFFHLIIDGLDIDFASPYESLSSYEHAQFVKQYLDYYTAEDIKGIEVMLSTKYAYRYVKRFEGMDAIPGNDVFVEVTTYAGTGPYLKPTPGAYVYRPLAFVPQMRFYSPKYTAKNPGPVIDARSTIYWTGNIITDASGKANVSFYTADKPGAYTLLMDGCDMNGNLESIRGKITVK